MMTRHNDGSRQCQFITSALKSREEGGLVRGMHEEKQVDMDEAHKTPRFPLRLPLLFPNHRVENYFSVKPLLNKPTDTINSQHIMWNIKEFQLFIPNNSLSQLLFTL